MCMQCIYKEIPYGCFVFCQQKISAQGFECKFRCAGMKTKKTYPCFYRAGIHKKGGIEPDGIQSHARVIDDAGRREFRDAGFAPGNSERIYELQPGISQFDVLNIDRP